MLRHERIPPPLSTDRLETALEAEITRYVSSLRQAIARQLLPRIPEILEAHALPRFDADEPGVAYIAGLRLEYLEIDPAGLQRELARVGGQVVELGLESVSRQLFEAVPAAKRQRLKALGLGTLEPWMLKRVQEWAALNAALITSLPEQLAAQANSRIWTAVRDGKRPETLGRELQAWLEVPPAKAQLLARDQVGKLQSDIIAGRQEELGIDRWWWMTAEDRRVVGRPGGLYPKGSRLHQDHWVRRNRLFLGSHVPLIEIVDGRQVVHPEWSDGLPGQGPIQCRCWRRPDISGLLRRL